MVIVTFFFLLFNCHADRQRRLTPVRQEYAYSIENTAPKGSKSLRHGEKWVGKGMTNVWKCQLSEKCWRTPPGGSAPLKRSIKIQSTDIQREWKIEEDQWPTLFEGNNAMFGKANNYTDGFLDFENRRFNIARVTGSARSFVNQRFRNRSLENVILIARREREWTKSLCPAMTNNLCLRWASSAALAESIARRKSAELILFRRNFISAATVLAVQNFSEILLFNRVSIIVCERNFQEKWVRIQIWMTNDTRL